MSECINILILGKTGVGKSTWINSIFNYLSFDALDEARCAKSLKHLIPYRINYTNEDGETYVVQSANASSEEHREDGQSATQVARSYLFKSGGRSIRFIDTPGIADVRGSNYDKINMEGILDHLTHYEELHAICVLLKPDESRLDVLFKFVMQELLSYLHASAKQNIFFCFTHCPRRPGETLPVLNKLLRDKATGLKATKENYFCFENQPFIFLACSHAKFQYSEDEVQDIYTSWAKSVSETEHLLKRIMEIAPHKLRDTISIHEARRVILSMCKPMTVVASTIKLNLNLLENVKEKEEVAGYAVVRYELPSPRTVCTHWKCIDYVCRGDANTTTVNYKQVCHHDCTVQGVSAEVANDKKLKSCQCMYQRNIFESMFNIVKSIFGKGSDIMCTRPKCGHSYKDHMHITYELRREKIVVMSTSKKTSLHQTVCELRHEEKTIMQVCAMYRCFLKQNCIIPINDAIGDHINMLITQEKEKPGRFKNNQELRRLQELECEYRHEQQILEDNTLMPEVMLDLKERLFQNKHTGKELKAIFDGLSRQQANWKPRETVQVISRTEQVKNALRLLFLG